MKNKDLVISVLQKYISAIQIIIVVDQLKTKKSQPKILYK